MNKEDQSRGFDLRKLYMFLRVVDVCDALDGIGYFNIGLMSTDVRPIWPGMRFCGPALTVRCVPANRPMWRLGSTAEIVNAHDVWFKEAPPAAFDKLIQPGHVVVCDTGGAGEVGLWGSANSLGVVQAGAVGIITDGYCRDTAEVILQKVPICCRARGRTIIPGRIDILEAQRPIGCAGAQVRAGDIVFADDDGVVVVPIEVAESVAIHARAILLADMRSRRKSYERLGMPFDETVNYEAVEEYFAEMN